MAKPNSVIKLRGKLGDQVHIDGKYGPSVRQAPKDGNKKDEAALEEQYSRTAYLNNLASELNRIIRAYSGSLKPTGFYQLLQKRFRKEPLNNRFMLLKQLEGMEVNSNYPLHKLGDARVTVTTIRKKITVKLEVLYHPAAYIGTYKANCYSYEVSLVCWANGDGAASHARQFGEWISLGDGLPDFEFEFNRPADAVHWLVCLKQQAGYNEEPIPSFCAEGMQIISTGTFNKKDMELFTKRKKEETAQAEKAAATKKQEQVTRVKAKTKRQL